MKKYARCVVLLLTLPASATISYVRSNAQWSGGAGTCVVALSATSLGDLIVVWSEWQTPTGTPNTITSVATDSQLNAVSNAVGPTVQSAATTPTAAQIFYAKNVAPGGDTVTVTFSGSVSSSACVIVEYSGADINNPLDSVSAGYSTAGNTTALLDSGTVAPANSNLLVFGAGFADQNVAMTTGAGFTSHQAAHGPSGSGMVEDGIVSGNNVLQRATACLGTCPGTTTGNWLMQMAVFRDASWTVSKAWSPSRIGQIRYADQFPGTTADRQITSAIADLPPTGGTVVAPSGTPTQNDRLDHSGRHGYAAGDPDSRSCHL